MVARLAPITTKKEEVFQLLLNGFRQRPTLPGRLQPSTIGTEGLNCCVRYGNRWDPFVITTGNCELFKQVRFSFPPGRFVSSAPALQFMFSPALRIVPRSPLPVNPFRLPFRFFRCPLRLSPHPDNCTLNDSRLTVQLVSVSISTQIACAKSSPRPISIIKLHMLPHFHR